ncbi:MAG TPA: hypothetical protein VM012_00960 [Flavitalea sp.]|nr:hypothetical protein [Flavitalea sp.]
MADGFQRRTQKGVGRNGKTVQSCTGKNPRNRKAPGASATIDMDRFFFIALKMAYLNVFSDYKEKHFSTYLGIFIGLEESFM